MVVKPTDVWIYNDTQLKITGLMFIPDWLLEQFPVLSIIIQDEANHKGHGQSYESIKTHLQLIHHACSQVFSPLPPLVIWRGQSVKKMCRSESRMFLVVELTRGTKFFNQSLSIYR